MTRRKKRTRAKSAQKNPTRQNLPSEGYLVVAHFLDDSLLKGTTTDFRVENDTFTLVDWERTVEIVTVGELKALFFVENLDGDYERRERKGFYADEPMGHKVMVEFFDGEVLFGYTPEGYSESDPGFYMYPGDPDSNNVKVFIVRTSAKRIRVLPLEQFAPTNS